MHQLCLGTTNAAVRIAALQALAGLAPRFCEPDQAAAMVQTMLQVRSNLNLSTSGQEILLQLEATCLACQPAGHDRTRLLQA